MREGRWGQFTTDEGVCSGDKVLRPQGHLTPLTGSRRSMLARDAARVPGDNLAMRQCQTVQIHCWLTWTGGEEKLRPQRARRDAPPSTQPFLPPAPPNPATVTLP